MTDSEYWQAIAAEVRANMARRQLSPADLAATIDKSLPTARDRLAGKSPFDLVELERVAAWLDVSIAELLGIAA